MKKVNGPKEIHNVFFKLDHVNLILSSVLVADTLISLSMIVVAQQKDSAVRPL